MFSPRFVKKLYYFIIIIIIFSIPHFHTLHGSVVSYFLSAEKSSSALYVENSLEKTDIAKKHICIYIIIVPSKPPGRTCLEIPPSSVFPAIAETAIPPSSLSMSLHRLLWSVHRACRQLCCLGSFWRRWWRSPLAGNCRCNDASVLVGKFDAPLS